MENIYVKINIWLTHKSVPAWSFSESNKAYIKEKLPQADIVVCNSKEDFLDNLKDSDIAVIWRFEQEWLKHAQKLKILATPSAGKDYFNVNFPDHIESFYGSFHGELMGETAIAMILAECRGVAFCARSNVPWPRADVAKKMRALRGAHVVILGFGNIGKWVAKYAKPFGVKITGVKRTASPAPDFFTSEDKIETINNLDKILPQADHLVVVLPSGSETDNLLDEKLLKLLPRHSVIYNLGRGNCIDESALATLLKEEKIAGAYLDVFKEEPPSENSPLRDAPNFYLTPHSSAIAPNYLDLFIDNFVDYLKTKK